MSEIATLRRRIGDKSKAQRDVANGNGTDRSYHLQYENVFNVIVQVDDQEKKESLDYTLDSSAGRVIFTAAPAADSKVTFDYNYAAYTDAELQELIDDEGLEGATVAVLEELTAETARFYDFTQGETANKRSQVFDHLLKLLEQYRAKATAEKRGSGLRFGKRGSGRDQKRYRRVNFDGTQDLTRYP